MIDCYASRTRISRVALRAPVRAGQLDDKRTSWVEFAYEGQWQGHASGPFVFDRDVFARILENFARQTNPITLTYEHPSAYDLGQPVPAAGRIHQLEVREGDDGAELWGLVEFTPRAAEMIRAGEYLYTSVVVDFASIDRSTGDEVGPELCQVGLVNDPFLDGQTPIRLSRAATVRAASKRRLSMDPKEVIAAVAKALGLNEKASPEQLVAALDAMGKLLAAHEGEAEKPADKADASKADAPASTEPAAEVVPAAATVDASVTLADAEPAAPADEEPAPNVDKLTELAALLEQVSGGKSLAAIFDAISANPSGFAELLGRAASDTGIADAQAATLAREAGVLRAEVTRLSAVVAEHSRSEAERKLAARRVSVERQVEDLVTSGRLSDASRAAMIELGIEAGDRFDALVASLAPVVPTGTIYASRGPAATRVTSDLAPEHETQLRKQLDSAGIRGAKQDQAVARHAERLAKRR